MLFRCWFAVFLLSLGCTKHSNTDAAAPDASGAPDAAGAADSLAGADATYSPDVLVPTVTCEDVLRHQATCGRIPDAEDYATNFCAALADRQSKWRPDFFAFFFSCLANHDCNMDDDECVLTAAQNSADPVFDMARFSACLQAPSESCEIIYYGVAADCAKKHRDCMDDAGHSFSEQRCFSIAALTESGRAQVPACLSLECTAVSECLSGLGTINP